MSHESAEELRLAAEAQSRRWVCATAPPAARKKHCSKSVRHRLQWPGRNTAVPPQRIYETIRWKLDCQNEWQLWAILQRRTIN